MKNIKLYKILIIAVLALIFLICSVTLIVTRSKYVTEMGWNNGGVGDDFNDYPYIVEREFEVDSQMGLFNALQNGYSYVKIKGGLDSPIIMTGNSLDLEHNLTIDLNGNEIQRNSREGLLTVREGVTLTIVDTAASGGGGLYNPTGNVLALSGGTLNVFGGKFESGPRPEEYLTNMGKTLTGTTATVLARGGADVTETAVLPVMPVETVNGKKYGNVYLDKPVTVGSTTIPADTYCYTLINGATSDDVASFDMSKADLVYEYASGEDTIAVFCYYGVIKNSVKPDSDGNFPNYAAVQMNSGELKVNVVSNNSGSRVVNDGSFYSYFGTPHTSCIYMTGGTMDVNTTGSFNTVNPADLPASLTKNDRNSTTHHIVVTDTNVITAKESEGSCIICNVQDMRDNDGVLNITQLKSATAYNGSIISVRGGAVNITNTAEDPATSNVFTKNVTMSHTDIPRSLDPDDVNFSSMDAAIFIQGGKIKITKGSVTVNQNFTESSGPKTTYGILVRGNVKEGAVTQKSELVCDGVSFTINGERSYGIYATRGDIQLKNGSHITVNSDNQCYGVYVANMGEAGKDAANVVLTNSNVNIAKSDKSYGTYVGDNTSLMNTMLNTAGGKKGRVASVAVYLNSEDTYRNGQTPDGTQNGGKVTLDGCNITSQEVGVAVNAGDLTFKNGGTITTYNASAVALKGGLSGYMPTVKFEGDDSTVYTVNSQVNRQGNGADKNQYGVDTLCWVDDDTAKAAGTHQYELYLPWHVIKAGAHGAVQTKWITGIGLASGEQAETPYENNNGIRVLGGNFICEGKLDMTFRGLYNDFDGDMYVATPSDPIVFDNIIIKSFAVVADTGGNIDIRHANIINTVGGGVKVQGGVISLGTPNAAGDGPAAGVTQDIVVETHGIVHSQTFRSVGTGYDNSDTWHFYPNLSGGHAIIARDGRVKIYGGTYTAYYGNGAAATTSESNSTTIDIYDGTFTGNMYHRSNNTGSGATTPNSPHTYTTETGPASHYGIKVMGGADINIYGGSFDGKNGGAMIRGQRIVENGALTNRYNIATAKIYSGLFGNLNSQDGFNIYDYATVYFGAYTQSELDSRGYTTLQSRQKLITVYGKLFTLAVNPLLKDIGNYVNVYVYYGQYNVMVDHDPEGTSWQYKKRWNYGMGAIDTTMKNVNFFIYNLGGQVVEASGKTPRINPAVIRNQATDASLNQKSGYESYKVSGIIREYPYRTALAQKAWDPKYIEGDTPPSSYEWDW